ncbi:MAG: DUF4097 family beta strand repeat-containing protein [bacterium]
MVGTIPVGEIVRRISIEGAGGDIDIYPEEGSEIRYTLGENLELSSEVVGDKLVVKIFGKGLVEFPFFSFGRHNGDIKLHIPQGKSLELNLKSGDMRFSKYKGDEISIKVASGDISIENLTCNSFNAHLTSGDVNLDVNTQNGNIDCRSGDIRAKLNGEGWKIDISGVSGDVDIETESNSLDIDVKGINGDISMNGNHLGSSIFKSKHLVTNGGRNKLNISVISGDVSITTGSGAEELNVREEKTSPYIPEEVRKVKEMYNSGKITREDAIKLIEVMGYEDLINLLEG